MLRLLYLLYKSCEKRCFFLTFTLKVDEREREVIYENIPEMYLIK